jgi:hypothetical protein
MIATPRVRALRVVVLALLACLCLAAPSAASASIAGHTADLRNANGGEYGRNFAGCLPEAVGWEGREITVSAPPKWTCGRLRRLWHHADTKDGEFFTFRLFGHRWQCPIIARPNHKRHTTLGCFHVHWKRDLQGKRPPGKPVVRFFLPFPAG